MITLRAALAFALSVSLSAAPTACIAAEPAPDAPVHILFMYHGNPIGIDSDLNEIADQIRAEVAGEANSIDAVRPLTVWLEQGFLHGTDPFGYGFLTELLQKGVLTEQDLVYFLTDLRLLPPQKQQQIQRELESAFARVQYKNEAYYRNRPANLHPIIAKVFAWAQDERTRRKVLVRFERIDYSSWIMGLQSFIWHSVGMEELAKGNFDTAYAVLLRSRELFVAACDARDRKLAEDIAVENGFNPNGVHIVVRGTLHQGLPFYLSHMGVASASREIIGRFRDGFYMKDMQYFAQRKPTVMHQIRVNKEETASIVRNILCVLAGVYVMKNGKTLTLAAVQTLDQFLARVSDKDAADWERRLKDAVKRKVPIEDAAWEFLKEKLPEFAKIVGLTDADIAAKEARKQAIKSWAWDGRKWEIREGVEPGGIHSITYVPQARPAKSLENLIMKVFPGKFELNGLKGQLQSAFSEMLGTSGITWKEQPGDSATDTIFSFSAPPNTPYAGRGSLVRVSVTPNAAFTIVYTPPDGKLDDTAARKWTGVLREAPLENWV